MTFSCDSLNSNYGGGGGEVSVQWQTCMRVSHLLLQMLQETLHMVDEEREEGQSVLALLMSCRPVRGNTNIWL